MPSDLHDDEATLGGTLFLPDCGYTVYTPSGATAPLAVAAGTTPPGPDPTPRQVHLGLASDPARSRVISWRTGDDSTLETTVRYGKVDGDELSRDGFSFWYRTPTVMPRMHEVHLCGLEPDTVYRYQVGGGETWSPERRFRTAPDVVADPSASVVLAVLGDSRGGQEMAADSMRRIMASVQPDAFLFTGDVVTDGRLQGEWDVLFEAGEEIMARVPVIYTHGNHENNAAAYYAQVALPGNEQWFGVDLGPVHLSVLNDTPVDSGAIIAAERTFLTSDLASHATAPWRIVMHHRSIWSNGGGHGSSATLLGAWGPIIDEAGVDLVLSGHDHIYERSRPMFGSEVVAPGKGTIYLVSGGAGAPLYASGSGPSTAVHASTRNYVILEARAGRLDVRAYRAADGSLLDSFSFGR